MGIKQEPPLRGRPKTLPRERVLESALMSYWADGPTNVSVRDICLKTGASKPGVYREFGSDDGLKVAVLEAYRSTVLVPLYGILSKDQSFSEAIDALILFTTQDRQGLGLPDGCLFVAMRARRDELGEGARKKVDQMRDETLENYKTWIDKAKSRNEFRSDSATDVAALYFDAQNGSAMRMQKEGVPNAAISEILSLAFEVFR